MSKKWQKQHMLSLSWDDDDDDGVWQSVVRDTKKDIMFWTTVSTKFLKVGSISTRMNREEEEEYRIDRVAKKY